MTIHAHTELHSSFPAFVNINEREGGRFALTVRARGNAGRDYASIDLNQVELLKLAADINQHFDGLAGAQVDASSEAVLAEFRRMNEQLGEQLVLMRESLGEQREAMARYDLMTAAYQAGANAPTLTEKVAASSTTFTFDEFVQYGRDNGGNIVRGMPWSFSFHGHVVSHENDECYLVGVSDGQVRFTPDQVLVLNPDGTLVMTESSTPRV